MSKTVNVNKTELVNMVAEKAELSKKEALKAVEAVFETIVSTLEQGGEVSVLGFGAWKVKERAARMARNLKTGEVIQVAACKVGAFKFASNWKKLLNPGKN